MLSLLTFLYNFTRHSVVDRRVFIQCSLCRQPWKRNDLIKLKNIIFAESHSNICVVEMRVNSANGRSFRSTDEAERGKLSFYSVRPRRKKSNSLIKLDYKKSGLGASIENLLTKLLIWQKANLFLSTRNGPFIHKLTNF